MPKARQDEERQADEHVRCFRCGQLYPCEHIVVLQDDCPAAFRGQPLCGICAETLKGKKGTGWWAQQAATAHR